ncbi:DUF427 domain-containing protein [Embleya sp. NBC_00896]|uniref:DUF427 domain-containing protein n=1 Tax=Embleya sp. NBC_00896 TaxID=2975961 RepID=UPI003866FB85|nr:DUF427 domain-containing protein [Embleya sp. NBC_00896]
MPSAARGHLVTTVHSAQTVTVEIDGQVVAKSSRPVVLYETGLPIRYYLPPDDVDLARFTPTDTHTTCPFKGVASYWTYLGDGTTAAHPDVVWAYSNPIESVPDIKGYLSFYDNIAHVTVEGEPPAPPTT